MSKKKRFVKREQRGDKSKKMSIISFGKPEPVLTTGTDYREIWYDNAADHYTQPIDRLALAQLINLNGQHGGIIHARKNMVTADYQGGGLTFDELEAAVFDYLTFGDSQQLVTGKAVWLNRVQLIAQDLRTHTNGSGHIFQIVGQRKRSASCIKMCMFGSLVIKHCSYPIPYTE